MRNTIKRILREEVSEKFFDLISKKLDQKNAEFAHAFDMSAESWRLGSEILYKTILPKGSDDVWCVLWGSPEQKVLIDQMAMLSNVDDYTENELKVYCGIINRYYDLTTPIPRDDMSVWSFLSRKYFVTILDGEAYDYDEHTGSEDDEYLSIGYEYNDYDENNEIGESDGDVIWFLKIHFKLNESDAKRLLYIWTHEQIQNGNFNG